MNHRDPLAALWPKLTMPQRCLMRRIYKSQRKWGQDKASCHHYITILIPQITEVDEYTFSTEFE